MQRTQNEPEADILEQLYDRYPLRLPFSFIAIAIIVIFLSTSFGPGPVTMFAGCATGLAFMGLVMFGYGLFIVWQRKRPLPPPLCPSCGADEQDGTVYMALALPETEQLIFACSRCERTWKTDVRK